MAAEQCIVCFESFNKSTRSATACPYCHTQICRTCLQTYLLNDINDDVRCVNTGCGAGWSREFLDGELTRTFRLETYKTHREKVLADRERARLPASQTDAANYKRAKEESTRLKTQIEDIEAEISKMQHRLDELLEARDLRMYEVEHFGRARGAAAAGAARREEAAVFVRPCPAEGCKGFLSTAWKCGLCNAHTCRECHELKAAEDGQEHACDPNKVASARLIDSESKACPTCGVRICKIEGCDQMWCTQCNTAFNWRTGRVAQGPVHNPHYFEWLARNNRAPEPGAGGCGFNDIDRQIMRNLNVSGIYGRGRPHESTDRMLYGIWRLVREIQDPYMLRRRDGINPQEEYRKLRVKYLADELTEEEWAVALQRVEKEANFQQAKAQVRELFLNAIVDIMRPLSSTTQIPDKVQIHAQALELINYCNECNTKISKRFGRKVPLLEPL